MELAELIGEEEAMRLYKFDSGHISDVLAGTLRDMCAM